MAFVHILLTFLLGTTATSLTFDQLPAGQGQVQLRGFAYQTTDGQWILSPDPGLKSCCVGSAAKARQQVVLSGTFDQLPKARAIVVEGRLRVNPTQEQGYYTLEEATVINQAPSTPWYTTAIALAALLLIGGYTLLTNKQRNT